MAREQSYTLAALNVAMHRPHDPMRYRALFRAIFEMRRIVRLGAQHGGMLGRLYREDGPPGEALMRGDLFSFLQWDPKEPWLNLRTGKAAEADDLAEVNLPENLRPAFKAIPFVFSPKSHKLVFVSKHGDVTMAPSTAARLLERLIEPLIFKGHFPKVHITPVQDRATLDRVFALPELKTLNITVTRPNPGDDDPQTLVRVFASQLEEQNATEIELNAKAARGQSLKPTEAVRAVAELAVSGNGRVLAKGKSSEGRTLKIDTADSPLLLVDSFNPATTTIYDRLLAAVDWFR